MCLIALVGTIGVIAYAAATPAPFFFRVPAGENIVFLAAANSDLPEPTPDLQKQGITVVYTYSDLIAATSQTDQSVDAIVIDASHLPEVAPAWLQSMYRNSVVIGAIDVTVHDLATVVGNDNIVNDPTWTDGWQKKPFYSILAYRLNASPEQQQIATNAGIQPPALSEGSSDNIKTPGDEDSFFSLIRRDIADMQPNAASAPTPTTGSNQR